MSIFKNQHVLLVGLDPCEHLELEYWILDHGGFVQTEFRRSSTQWIIVANSKIMDSVLRYLSAFSSSSSSAQPYQIILLDDFKSQYMYVTHYP
jgi:hypothetical protein